MVFSTVIVCWRSYAPLCWCNRLFPAHRLVCRAVVAYPCQGSAFIRLYCLRSHRTHYPSPSSPCDPRPPASTVCPYLEPRDLAVIHLCRLPSAVIHTEPIVCRTPAVRRTPPPCRNRLSRLPSRLPSCRRLPLPSAFIRLYRRRPRLCPSCVRAQPPHLFHAPARASTFCSGARRPQRRPERLRVTGAAAPELGIRCCLQRPASEGPKPEPGSFPDPAVSIPFARCRAVPFSYQSYHSPKKR